MNSSNKKILVFDFGLGDVRVAAVQDLKDSRQIIATSQVDFSLETEELSLESTTQACRDAIQKLSGIPQEFILAPDQVIVGLPLSFSFFVRVRETLQRPHPEKEITAQELTLLRKHLQDVARQNLRLDAAENYNETFEYHALYIHSVLINGYKVSDMIGKNGSEILIEATACFISPPHRDFFNHLFIKNLSLPSPEFLHPGFEIAERYAFQNKATYGMMAYTSRQETFLSIFSGGFLKNAQRIPINLSHIFEDSTASERVEKYLLSFSQESGNTPYAATPVLVISAQPSSQNSANTSSFTLQACQWENLKLSPPQFLSDLSYLSLVTLSYANANL